jgi:hypothetical protein
VTDIAVVLTAFAPSHRFWFSVVASVVVAVVAVAVVVA